MRDQLLAYLLDDLEPDQRARIEKRLRDDPIWQRELQRLKACMEAYESDPQQAPCPPEDLVHRTCSFVQQAIRQQHVDGAQPSDASASLTESCDAIASRSRRWSWADLTVAAGVLVAVGLLALPALRESRETARRLQCQHNLQTLGQALAAFAKQTDGSLPQIGRNENAGMFVVQLAERGILTREQLAELLVCPSTQLAADVFHGKIVMRIPSREQLRLASPVELAQLRQHMSGNFAYSIGWVDQHGEYRHIDFNGRGDAPLLADAPSFEVAGFQSANHGGCGQNVVSQDLSVRYLSQCATDNQRGHLYLNDDQEHKAGCAPDDWVLLLGGYGPFGPLTDRAER